MNDRRKGNVYLYYRGSIWVSGTQRYLYTCLVIWPQVGRHQATVHRYAVEASEMGTIIDFWRCKHVPKRAGKSVLVKAENWIAGNWREAQEFCQGHVHRHVAELLKAQGEDEVFYRILE